MKNSSIFIFNYHLLFLLVLLFGWITGISAQNEGELGTEVVNVVKPYTPTISDAFKIKEKPVSVDTIFTKKKEVEYTIFSVPVASTFTPAKGKATVVEKTKPIKLYDNYATVGFGNYTTVTGELFSNFELSRTDNAGFSFKHNSSQGGISDIRLDDSYYDTSLEGYYSSNQRDLSYGIYAGIEHQLFNWYGVSDAFEADTEFITNFDAQQIYYGGFLGGNMVFDESMFKGISAEIRYLGDAYSSSEIIAAVTPQFSIPISGFTLEIDSELFYLTGSFDRSYYQNIAYKYGFLNASVSPTLEYNAEEFEFTLGIVADVVLDTEENDTEFLMYPKLKGSYKLMDDSIIGFAGIEGGIHQNTYFYYKNKNPFISPTLEIEPTHNVYNAYAGIKGKLSNSIGYELSGSYSKSEDHPFFKLNSLTDGSSTKSYQYGNSFQVVYDELKEVSVKGELKVAITDGLSFGVNANYHSYLTTQLKEAWNLPVIEASIFSNFNITDEFYAGVSLFYVGERMDEIVDFGPSEDPFPKTVTLDAYVDANVQLGYNVSDKLSLFLKGNNLVGGNYQKWYNYPVQGIQGLMGATYKFDW